MLTQFMYAPTSFHYQAAKRAIRYLAGSPDRGILLASHSSTHLQGYCDIDWAACSNTKRSNNSRFCLLLGQSPIA